MTISECKRQNKKIQKKQSDKELNRKNTQITYKRLHRGKVKRTVKKMIYENFK